MYYHMKKVYNLIKSDEDFSVLTIWAVFLL